MSSLKPFNPYHAGIRPKIYFSERVQLLRDSQRKAKAIIKSNIGYKLAKRNISQTSADVKELYIIMPWVLAISLFLISLI